MLSRSFLLILLFPFALVSSLRPLAPHPCDPKTLPDPRTLRSDQMTVLINGYAKSRISLLRSIATGYSASPVVASVVVLWGNPSTPPHTLALLSHNLSSSAVAAPISLVRQSSHSLNARFLPRPFISTRAVLICDDDVQIDSKSIDFAFKIWTKNRDRLVGFFARSHELDLPNRRWIYTVHPEKYSIVLTKFMITKVENLYSYSCQGGKAMDDARAVVDEMHNCEDILMNFVAAEEAGAGPVLVGAERARDWGDARNEARGEKEAGLSSRRGDHRKRRGECIRKFHRALGRMPLRYSYGKVVNSVGEQGLCVKGGRLVLCDEQIAISN